MALRLMGTVELHSTCSTDMRLSHTFVRDTRIDPIPPESRTDTRMFQIFFVWFSANMNVLGYVGIFNLAARVHSD